LSSGLSSGVGQIPPGIAGTPLAAAVQNVFNDAITQGTRWAAFTAAIFVSFGALSSLLIPNPKGKPAVSTGQVQPVAPMAKSTRIVIVAQFLAITGLLAAISWDYQQNTFMQQWFTTNASPIGFILAYYLSPILFLIIGAGLIAWKLNPRTALQKNKAKA